jgi:nucleoid-associated protein YgaU
VEVVGDSVKIRGTVPSQEIKEKVILAAGNVEGVSKVEEELRTTEKKPEAVVHTVVKGDTLWAIAKKSYSDGSKYKLIFLRQIGRCSSILRKIYPGQVLRIPPLENEA